MKQSFVVLSEKILDRYLDVPTTRHRTKSGITPHAQTVTLCNSGSREDILEFIPPSELDRMKKESIRLFYLLQFLLSSACRISEALKIKPNDITQLGHVNIKALKGSNDRIISGGMSSEYLIKCKKNNISPWGEWSRFFVYHQFKKYNVGIQIQGTTKRAVTHAPRHIVSSAIKKANMNQELSKQALGHKTTKANDYYFK
jgi:site-specific recombinase XerD